MMLRSTYFDGRSPKAHAVRLQLSGDWLEIEGDVDAGDTLHDASGPSPVLHLRIPVREVQWPERQRHGVRLAHLPGGAVLSHDDGPAWDAWAASVVPDSWVVRSMQSWRGASLAGVLSLAALAAAWAWGVPAATLALVAAVPAGLEAELGEQALRSFDAGGLLPSQLPATRQAAIRQALEAALRQASQHGNPMPAHALHFRRAGRLPLGPNAFALPGGTLVVTDELVTLLDDRPDVILGVLAHEMGHVRHRHGLRMVVQASLVSALSSVVLGDTTGWLATVPAVLGQQAYSRDFEREADDESIRVLRANQLSPALMAVLFERLREARRKDADEGDSRPFALPIAIASHPSDEERIARFRNAQ